MAVSNELPEAAVGAGPRGWRPNLAVSGLVGVIALGVTLAAAELLAVLGQLFGWLNPASSPLSALGQSFIGLTPEWLKQFAIRAFGSNDKTALMVGMGLTLLVVGFVLGMVGRDRPRVAVGIAVALLVVAGAAVLSRPDASVIDLLPLLLGGAAGIAFLVSAFRRQLIPGPTAALGDVAAPTPGSAGAAHPMLRAPGTVSGSAGATRRDFLRFAGFGALAAVAAGAVSRWIPSTAAVAASRSAVALPAPTSIDAADAPTDTLDDVPGISPFVTPNTDFYRIDTAFVVPRMTTDEWQLRVHGLVDKELTLSWSELLAMPSIAHMVTLTCVSNPVGGDYVGNATWQGVRIADLLKMAGPQAGADCVYSTSVDGFTVTTPLDVLTDGRDALLAYAMNGEPLPVEHGFPVRMVVPGLYGFVSATKWVVDLELTTFADATAYWTSRGWSAKAPIKTSSRIDVPRGQASVSNGTVAIAGVAWAQHRGVTGVQVQIDDGP
ncbi:MAG TPA: molybdopterin-dependent oxidoreductase, partial [Nakamurella sp.]